MPFPPFSSGPSAFVVLNQVTTPMIQFTADDDSCRWNGFPVYIIVCDWTPIDGTATYTSYTPVEVTLGPLQTSDATDWPPIFVYDSFYAVNSGFKLQARVSWSNDGTGGLMNLSLANEATGACITDNTDGGTITAWTDCGPDCIQQGTLGHDWLEIGGGVHNASLGATFHFTALVETRYVASGDPVAPFQPNQQQGVEFRPPCYVAQGPDDLDAGLYIYLGTDECGNLTTTYGNIRDMVNVHSLGITATVLGGHSTTIAVIDENCDELPIGPLCVTPQNFFACLLDGAECSGAVDN